MQRHHLPLTGHHRSSTHKFHLTQMRQQLHKARFYQPDTSLSVCLSWLAHVIEISGASVTCLPMPGTVRRPTPRPPGLAGHVPVGGADDSSAPTSYADAARRPPAQAPARSEPPARSEAPAHPQPPASGKKSGWASPHYIHIQYPGSTAICLFPPACA